MENLFVDDLSSLVRIAISAPIIYALIILYIRLFGKRTTSQMNSFDWVVTVAIGSIGASAVLLEDVPILSGAVSILALMLSQYIVTTIMMHSAMFRNVVRSTPKLLLFEGEFLMENMREERVVKSEVYAVIRESGLPNINEVYAVVLETDAKFSVIGKSKENTSFSLADVQGLPDGLKEDLEEVKESGNFPR